MATGNPVGAQGLVRKASGWMMAMAVVFIILGIMAIAEPMVAGLAVALLVGWLLIFGGVAHAIAAFAGGGAGRVVWQLLLAIVYVIGGLYFITHPLLGLGSLTLFLAAILVMEAIVEIAMYFQTRALGGSRWQLVNAMVTLLLGALIWIQWPSSAVWAIGLLVGVNLLMTGISRFMIASVARRLTTP